MSDNNTPTKVGPYPASGLELLTILFIALKLTKVIDWSWWWVLAPIWITVCLAVVGGLVIFVSWRIFKDK